MARSKIDALPDLSDLFKTHPQPDALLDMVAKYRNIAKKHLQETIPEKLTSLQRLLDTESDASSPLWPGHVESTIYTQPLLLQPTDERVQRVLTKGAEVVLPSEVVRAKGADYGDVDDDRTSDGGEKRTTDDVHSKRDGNGHGQGYNDGSNGHSNGNVRQDGGENGQLVKGVRTGPHWFEVVPQNKIQGDLIKLSVKEHEDLHMITQDLRIWLELEVPLIEDGNSFGADVQNHLIKELLEAYKKSNAYQNGCRAHYGDRLKLAQDWVKYPNLMDFPAAIAASDRFDHFLLRSYLRSLLISYGGLLTKFGRNWQKVINPKSSSSGGGGMY